MTAVATTDTSRETYAETEQQRDKMAMRVYRIVLSHEARQVKKGELRLGLTRYQVTRLYNNKYRPTDVAFGPYHDLPEISKRLTDFTKMGLMISVGKTKSPKGHPCQLLVTVSRDQYRMMVDSGALNNDSRVSTSPQIANFVADLYHTDWGKKLLQRIDPKHRPLLDGIMDEAVFQGVVKMWEPRGLTLDSFACIGHNTGREQIRRLAVEAFVETGIHRVRLPMTGRKVQEYMELRTNMGLERRLTLVRPSKSIFTGLKDKNHVLDTTTK